MTAPKWMHHGARTSGASDRKDTLTMAANAAPKITGHLGMDERKGGRVWVAKYVTADGRTTRKVLGSAWAKDSGRKTPRGAVVWRAADGKKPDGYLTPAEARVALAALMGAEQRQPHRQSSVRGKTFGEAAGFWLDYCEHDRAVAATTLRGYKNIATVHLLPEFGEATPLARISIERVERYRDSLVASDLSSSRARQVMLALSGILGRAQRRGWLAHNPVVDVERVTVKGASGDFNVLDPVHVEACARAAVANWQPVPAGERDHSRLSDERAAALSLERERWAAQMAELIRVAAYTGLRIGELRALRWKDVDWSGRILHVRKNAPSSTGEEGVKTPKSGKVRSVPLAVPASKALDALSRRERFVGAEDRVFVTATGGMIDGGKARDSFYAALQAAGLGALREKDDPITFHDLRHTFGTLAVREAPVTDVQFWMGHKDIQTTMRYVHHVPRPDAAERLSRAFAFEVAGEPVPVVAS